LLALGLAWPLLARAQELEIAVSPSPVGSGARAAGMADAFVAIADDATAASWNPAGLVQLERPEISIVGSFNGLYEEFGADWHDEVDSHHDDHNVDLNYLSVAYPLPMLVLGRNVCVSLNYQRKYDFSRRFKLNYNIAQGYAGGVFNDLLEFDFEQSGGLSTVSPAIATEITHRLAVGAAFNFWRSTCLSDNSWEQKTKASHVTLFGNVPFLSWSKAKEEYADFSGENMTLGLLWNVTDRWSVGARYDTAFTGEADYTRVGSTLGSNLFGGRPAVRPPDFVDPRYVKHEKRHVRFPASLALGVAYRPNDRLTLSLDVTRTDWNDFYFKDAAGRKFSLVNAEILDNILDLDEPHFDHTTTVRLGAEYVFVPKQPDEEALDRLWTLRGGLFYDPEPASEGRDDFYGLALGCGLLARQRVNVDLAYQFRYGHDVNHDFIRGVPGFREDVLQHRVLLSTVIYF